MKVAFFIFLGFFICSVLGLLTISGIHSFKPNKHTVKSEIASSIFSIFTFISFIITAITGLAAF